MHPTTLYEERIFSRGFAAIGGGATLVFVASFLYQLLVGPFGKRPTPNVVYLLASLISLAVTLNFSRLVIRMTPQALTVGYGVLKHTIPWENVADGRRDDTSAFWYGGWGLRIARVGKHWRLVFNLFTGPRVIVALKRGRFQEVVFTTQHPDQVIALVRQRIV